MAKQWRVLNNTPGARNREHFAGNEEDARTFVQNNFPLAHVEPPSQESGIPDVKLVSPSGAVEHYHRHNGWRSGDGHPTADDDTDSADSEVE